MVAGASDLAGLCGEVGEVLATGARTSRAVVKLRAGAVGRFRSRRHSGVSALLKGRVYFYPADTKALLPPVFRPSLKGKLIGSRSPPSGRSGRIGWFYPRSSESKFDDLGPLRLILPTLLSCVKHTSHCVLERDSHSHQNPPRWFVCSSLIPPAISPSLYLCNIY